MIENMPTYLGQQFYPGGFPVPADQVRVNGVSVLDRFIQMGTGAAPNLEDRNICRDYIRYYVLSPCFDLLEDDETKVHNADYDELWDICFNNGIDPF